MSSLSGSEYVPVLHKLLLFSLTFLLQLYRVPMLVTDPPQMEHYPHAKSTTYQPNALIEIIIIKKFMQFLNTSSFKIFL